MSLSEPEPTPIQKAKREIDAVQEMALQDLFAKFDEIARKYGLSDDQTIGIVETLLGMDFADWYQAHQESE